MSTCLLLKVSNSHHLHDSQNCRFQQSPTTEDKCTGGNATGYSTAIDIYPYYGTADPRLEIVAMHNNYLIIKFFASMAGPNGSFTQVCIFFIQCLLYKQSHRLPGVKRSIQVEDSIRRVTLLL